jgi:hypothetical protein
MIANGGSTRGSPSYDATPDRHAGAMVASDDFGFAEGLVVRTREAAERFRLEIEICPHSR